ncbi:uncharacterized protein LOC120643962 [Panicum virgatum]|uniref:uncharacterized protein LOC120643962 n=1 Tax=Panicum virgatum TaxID=38727 RepID=UPI0019D6388C|nr:uncharacterized protein LOC120643962 [Panicum virgatum]
MMATAACRKLSSGRSVPEPLPLVPGRAHLSQGVPPLGLATAAKLLKSVGARSTGAACLMVQTVKRDLLLLRWNLHGDLLLVKVEGYNSLFCSLCIYDVLN